MTPLQIIAGIYLVWQACSALKNCISLAFNVGISAFILHYVMQVPLDGIMKMF